MVSKFTPTEKRIINLLYVAHRPLTTKQISEKLGVAWKTAKDNLMSLHKKGYVNMEDLENRIYWWLKAK
jgi:Mn-dependent DtxR family transcriptional regulator